MRPDPALRNRLHRALLRRGQTIATTLAELLADADRAETLVTALGLTTQPGIRPEEALRKALDQVERRRVLLDAGDDRYGQCDVCGAGLGVTALLELPWADRCEAHRAA